jgi:hypothetical protein
MKFGQIGEERVCLWRRRWFFCWSRISVDPGTPAGAKIPVRLLYPQNEYNYNPDNVGAEGTISPTNTRIFWT